MCQLGIVSVSLDDTLFNPHWNKYLKIMLFCIFFA